MKVCIHDKRYIRLKELKRGEIAIGVPHVYGPEVKNPPPTCRIYAKVYIPETETDHLIELTNLSHQYFDSIDPMLQVRRLERGEFVYFGNEAGNDD